MNKNRAPYIILLFLFACKAQHKREMITIIPATDYLFYYYGDSTKVNSADSIIIKGDQIDNKKMMELVNRMDDRNDSIILKPSSASGGLGHAKLVMDILDSNELKYSVRDSMTLSEKKKFRVGDMVDIRSFVAEMSEKSRPPDPKRDGTALLFFVKPSKQVFYKIDSNYTDSNSIPVGEYSVENIGRIIKSAQRIFESQNKKLNIFIGGDENSKYSDIEVLFDALRENNFHDYKLLMQ